ncbi:triose-phosphate isomerase [Mesorhizobium sp. SEMIA 3007]|uniref:triose-phosphate isomerase n=1 Tax=Mesorhizobium sp. SEMIA 3007 TaxID=1862350 RepID=UPI00083D2051|nr:triose-phosphate isomerase [Mesorhizobium sp. SEMIA 3007]ODA97504.1 triose-phosphate isomerase [Mesorhizobium sp. SEMIA 3007]
MTPGTKPLVAGNWKMNGLRSSLDTLKNIASGAAAFVGKTDMLICPPATLLREATSLCSGAVLQIGAQDCHPLPSGAHTGEISAAMVADCGATFVIVGHSERRDFQNETDAIVRSKAVAAHGAGLVAIVCVGETGAERQSGETLNVLKRQLACSVPDGAAAVNTVIAYEPVWAIGTGLTPTTDDIREAHAFMRAELVSRFGRGGTNMRILYGGSVKASNAAELMAIDNVDGALVGGASLKADDFLAIAGIYETL